MKKSALIAILTSGTSSASRVTPVQKVVQMMESMRAKGKKEKHEEEVQFAKYNQFCDDTTVSKKRAIAEAAEKIEALIAAIEKNSNDVKRLTKEIGGHNGDIGVWQGDKKAATNVRKLEKADYDTTHTDYSESIDALNRAIAVLKKQSYDRKQASSLLQVSALMNLNLLPVNAKKAIGVFLSEPDELPAGAPEANAYEFQSSGVVEMLEKLLDKFIEEKTALEKVEANSKHSFNMLVQDLDSQIAQAEADVSRKTTSKTKKQGAIESAKEDKVETTTAMNEDQKYLDDLMATCELKAVNFEARQKLRSEELEAIAKAIEIISSGAVAGNADKHLPALTQTSALVKLRAQNNDRNKVAEFLKHRASSIHSRVLAQAAEHVAGDPLGKVKKMIKDLIVKLMEEANEEAEHKGWCDTELSTNEQTRVEKTSKVDTLHAEADQLAASISKITEEIDDLTQALSDLAKNMAEATELRQTEKEKNAETIRDSKEAQAAVAQALTVLKEFYGKSAEATALVQEQPVAPDIFDEPYKGMQGENGGVVGMLEVIRSDFARLESDTSASESSAQQEYDTFMTDSKVDKAAKSASLEHKTAKKKDQEKASLETKHDLEGTQKELDAALAYFDKLKPSCIDAGVSYEDRVARRKEEIQSLKDALRILNGEELA